VDIVFKSSKEAKLYNTQKSLIKKFGLEQATRIRRRLDQLRNAEVLEDLRKAPGRCHELTKNRAGQLSLDLEHPYRLIFKPANAPIPCKPDGGLDWSKITAVEILEVFDTHD